MAGGEGEGSSAPDAADASEGDSPQDAAAENEGGAGGDPAGSDAAAPSTPHPELVSAEQVHVAFEAYRAGLKKEGDGRLRLFDDQRSEDLVLAFESILPGVRKVEGRGFLVEAKFSVEGGEKGQHYDLHFWLNYRTDRDDKADATELDVTDTRIFRVPKKQGGAWVMEARYDLASERPTEVN